MTDRIKKPRVPAPGRKRARVPLPAALPVPPVHRVPAHLARRFHQICLGVLSEVTAPEQLSPVEYAILGSLDDSPGIDQRTLAERIGMDTVSAHQSVGRLEARGLIKQTGRVLSVPVGDGLLGRVVDANEAYARPGNGRRPPSRKR